MREARIPSVVAALLLTGGAILVAYAQTVSVPEGETTPERPDSESSFERLADGILVRKTYATGSESLRVEIWDFLIAPGQVSAPIELPGAVVFEVRSGGGALIGADDKRTDLHQGSTTAVDQGNEVRFDNRDGDRALTLRGVVVSAVVP